MRVFFSPAAEKDFKALPRAARDTAENYLRELAAGAPQGKPLHGPLRGFFVCRFNSGGVSYRLVYENADGTIIVLMIGSRDNFYNKFVRRVR